MKTKLLILLVFSLHMAGQERIALSGRVTVADANAPGIFVINKNTGIALQEQVKDAAILQHRQINQPTNED